MAYMAYMVIIHNVKALTVNFIAAIAPDFDGKWTLVLGIAIDLWEIAARVQMSESAHP